MKVRHWFPADIRRKSSTDTGNSDVQAMLRCAELDAEKTSAIIRLVVFLSLALTIFYAAETPVPGDGALAATGLYGLGTALGLLLAWRGIFHPAIPYLFVTFDVILVVAQVLVLARLMGMQTASPFVVPAAALIFIILIHAAMRYRPWLIAYAALLFFVAIELGPLFFPPVAQVAMGGMHSMPHTGMVSHLNFQVLPLVVVALAAFMLFFIAQRTRRLLLASIKHGARAARLSRYFSPNLATRIADGDDDQLLAGRRQSVAVLFVDIRGFTALGETMPPDELSTFLSEYRNRLTQPVFSNGGTVDKFIGDAIMVVFGSPIQGADDAECAVQCALEILDATTRWSVERERAGQTPVAVGIGAHYGEVFAGAVGSGQLLEFTVIGDTVNVAERLERLSREVDSPLVASKALLEAAGGVGKLPIWCSLPPQYLKGHRTAVEALCLTPARD